MLLRFRTGLTDITTGHPAGIFRAVSQVMDDPALPDYQHAHLAELLDWFYDELPIPHAFNRSTNSRYRNGMAICWLRESATEHVSRMHEMRAILEQQDVFVEQVWTTRPGYVVYEDALQVVALPYASTPT